MIWKTGSGLNNWGQEIMANESLVLLDTNDNFPELVVSLISGETLNLPEATGAGYGIVLFYRGGW